MQQENTSYFWFAFLMNARSVANFNDNNVTCVLFSPENLEKFVNDFLGGKLESYIKSEPIPTSDDGDVKVRACIKTLDQF